MHWLNWIIGYVIFVIGLPHGQGSCVFEGIQIENGTVWKSDSCHICTCLSPVTVCEQVTCQDPRCNIQQGEVYRIPSGNCCPECFTPGPPCVYKGQTREFDSKWHVSLCESCHCTEKGVICTNKTCPALHCKHGEEKQSLPHVCCPKCFPTGSSCMHQGVHYLDGAVWEPTHCIRCSCQDGEVTCFTAQCPDLRCDQGSSVVQLPSTCCPQCVEDMCYVGGKQYKSGDEWQEDSCTYCRCSSGHSQCRKVQCEDTIQCEPGEKKLLKPGDCCPSCVAEEAPCVYSGGLYYHGDMWNTSQCEFCTCDRGRVNCHQARCERRHCEQDEMLTQPAGGCCQECGSPRMCREGDSVYKDGEHWNPDPCRLCVCVQGSPVCYTKYCCDSGHQCVQEKLLTTKGTVTVLPAGFVNRLSQDWPSDTSVRVIEEPRHGSMMSQMYGPASTFTVSSLRSGDIMYRHDGGEALYDSVLLQISDGRKVKNELLEIEVQSKGKSVPVMEVNMGAEVETGKMVLLTKDMLHSVSGGKQKSNLIYTITGSPKEGTLLMIVPIPPEGARGGWKDRGDGTMGATMYRFLQRDVDEKRLWYQHKGRASTGKDRFIFEVSEGTNSPNILRNQVFHISVLMPQGDAPSTAPTVAPGVDLSMKVLENQLVPIMSAHLAFENIDSDDRDIVYTITSPLQSTQGSVEHIREPFQPVFRFTQEDINMNKIIYRPPMTEIGPEEKKFTFDFIVQDRTSGFAIPKQTFSIYVMPVNNMPPRLLQNEPSVKVTQGGSVLLGPDVIALIDTDTSVDDLSLTLTQNPVAGKVTKTSNGRRSELRIDEEMTYADVKNNAVMYQHDGSRRLEDMLYFKVSDGVHTVPVGVKVSVTRADRASPMADKQASFSMTLPEGDTSTIEKKHMAFTDIDTSDDKLIIKVVMDPMQGTLKRGREILTRGSSFTQQDINNDIIKYTAASEIGSRPINEILYFNVTDPNNHVLANQILTITIDPVNNQAPVVTVGPGVEVEEGGRVQLTPQHLSAMDMDTPVSLLTVVIDALPSFGVVKNSLRGLGSEQGRPSVVTTFPLQDLLDGGVCYVQTDHKNKEPVTDGFLFHVTDGTNDSPSQRFNISILLTNDEAPVMVTEQLHCQEGRGVVMTNATMYVIDFDSVPEELLFTVEALPQHGKLRRKEYIQDMIFSGKELQQGATFTYEDILNELIGYTHEGGEVDGDEFTLQLTDGKFTDRKTMKVVIGLVNDETPRVVVNRGLQVSAGSTTVIGNNLLKASDVDSEDSQIIYTITEDLSSGKLKLVKGQLIAEITKDGHQSSFTQLDIDEGHIQYVHDVSEPAGPTLFKFRLSDPEDNVLIDQSFVITVLEDRIPPQVTANKEFSVKEGGAAKITTQFLSATDTDSEPANLLFSVLTPPQLGHIALVGARGMPVSQFRQSDLAAGQVQYVHTSSEEIYMDSFTFSVTDGTNDVTQTFYLTITPVDDSLPVVSVHGLKVQEGVRKVVTEFDLKAVDKDTKEDHIFFTVIQHPRHGSLDLLYNGQQTQATRFSMADIYENRVSYQHDGSETLLDSFTFTTSDGTNHLYMMQQDQPEGVPLSRPLLFEIAVSPVDDGSPIITTNLGLHYLEYVNGKAMNAITSKELKAADLDTQDKALIYQIKEPPQYGRIENSANPDVPISLYSQEDINNGVIRYVLFTSTNETKDKFTFDLMDSKPNIVKEQVFHIRWSYINFELPDMNITESSGVIRVPVKRIGNLKQYSIVQCKAIPGSAVSASSATGIVRPGMNDYEAFMGQVQFDEWQDTKTCTIVINDDSIFEGPETFYVELSQPAYALLGTPTKASITIYDLEDEPVVQFEKGLYHVNESDGFLYATLTRSGDLSSSSSVVCSTLSMTAIGSDGSRLESGADFKTRQQTDANRVVFSAGETEASCDVQIIDDSNYETLEQFEIVLSDPSMMTKVGPISKAIVIIDGPNDESLISFAHESAWFDEDAGIVEIPVIRDGSDLSHSSMVWCATKMVNPPSATPGQDYVPTSNQITFGPGQNVQVCKLTILDDNADPRVEGNETFIVFLSSAMGSSLTEPISALITINDTDLDIPTMQFEKLSYVIDEEEKFLDIPIIRTGDLSYSSSVVCFTRQKTAHVMMDFHERTKTQDSRITFFPGEQMKNCRIGMVDDTEYEPDEIFKVKLTDPEGTELCGAAVGDKDTATITITNKADVPTIQIESAAYSVHEPNSVDKTAIVVVKILRTGDNNGTSRVRVSTRDGSAMSGMDYNPKSKMVKFKPGETSAEFSIEVLYNEDVEWHETFMVVLGPEEPFKAVFGKVTMATVTILDHEVSGSLILPAPPVVVSLLDYDNVEVGVENNPSPGYPIICVTPCDLHYPTYSITGSMCNQAGINQSAVHYRWEVAMPVDLDGTTAPFEAITDNTLFTSVEHSVLESIHFRPGFRVRCLAQPVDHTGSKGVPLRSEVVVIGTNNGICHSPISTGTAQGLQAQSFIANLKYVSPSDEDHPNRIHISIQIPHQDGMLPLISTYPLHNLRFLLTEPVYRQQHVCSNMLTSEERSSLTQSGFLDQMTIHKTLIGPGFDRPYQFDLRVREPKAINFYKHLNLKSCIWTFDAWYHMTELMDICGGAVISDFMVRDAAQTYLTIRVPLYVSYIYTMAPTGWGSLEHRTEMEFSFFYNTVLWRTGLETEGQLSGRLQVLKIVIGEDGKLIVDFKTQAKFRGQYVLEHHTLPGFKSRVLPPDDVAIDFDLALIWSQQTFDAPVQLWRATSKYNLKDYSGEYTIDLLPCAVKSTQSYSHTRDLPVLCTAHHPERFLVPISFQQTNRPVPVAYSLNTQFQLTNNEKMFLLDPKQPEINMNELDYNGAFTKGQTIYGRVLWNPEQDLDTAYELRIEKVYICTGKDGYVPTYDPLGDIYNEGPQYGCIQPSPYLKYRFLILDRGNPEAAVMSFNNVDFGAELASENLKYISLVNMPGVDGFILKVDPLYKVDSGHQWYLQVIYVIGPADRLHRYQRDITPAITKRDLRKATDDVWMKNSQQKNGTNIMFLRLNMSGYEAFSLSSDEAEFNYLVPVVPAVCVFLLILVILIVVLRRRAKRKKQHSEHSANAQIKLANNDNIENMYRDLPKPVHIRSNNLDRPSNLVLTSKGAQVKIKDTNLKKSHKNVNTVGTEV